MRNYPTNVFSAVDTASSNGPAIWVGQSVSGTFVTNVGDTGLSGSLKIQGSNDSPVGAQPSFTPTHWNDIPSATATIISGVCPAIVIATMSYQYIRVVFTYTSGGSSTISVNMSALAV